MSFLGNVLWIILGGGLITCLEYLLAGVILCLTLIGIPFGMQCFKLAGLALLPFGRRVVDDRSASQGMSLLMNLVWILVAGIWIALTHLAFALGCAITIIGIPFAVQHLKLAVLGLSPFGKVVVPHPGR